MSAESSSWTEFCGFANGSSFRTKYFMDESTMTLTPCGEFALVMPQTLPLLFFSVINFQLVPGGFPSFDCDAVSHIFTMKIIVCAITIASMTIAFGMSFLPQFYLKPVFLIEYSIIAIVWTALAVLLTYSKFSRSWTRTRAQTIAGFFASKVFIIMTVNRWLLYGFSDPRTCIVFSLALLHLTLGATLSFVEWKYYRSYQSAESFGYIELGSTADESAGFLSRVFFCWTNILIQKGGKLQLNSIDDVFPLPPSLEVANIERQMIENSPTYYSDGQRYSLSSSLLSTFGFAFFSLAVLRVASDGFTFAGPILLHYLVDVLENPTPNPIGFLYAGLMVMCSLLAALFSTNFNFYVQKITLKVRAATVTAIYDKLLLVPMSEMSKFSSGAILNFISTDVDRLVNFCNSFHAFWSLPVQLAVALYLLYREVGLAFVAGVIAAVILIPLNKWVTNAIGRMSVKLMHCKDQRIKVVRETMEGIRAVKSSAWESFFEKKINELREKELYYLKIRKYLDAVFTALALVNILIMPLNAFPWVLNGLVEALVSLRRLQRLFMLNNVDVHDVYTLCGDKDTLLYVREGNFFWRGSKQAITNVSFQGHRGKIIGISGDVGSGKSTLLLGLLGETKSLTECIGITQESVSNGIGYLGQDRWLYRGTVRENIIAGKDFDAKLYDAVIKMTCLQRDINLMPGGDQYEISDNGASLSGGQRTRVALARAFYQDNSMYLLDEPLASLDKKVADSIWVEGIEKRLRDRGCLVVIATHDRRVLSRVDEVVLLGNDGKVVKKGTPEDVLGTEVDELGAVEDECEEDAELERIMLQDEERRVGTVKASVAHTYMLATGCVLTISIVVALCLMQFSKNTADWWLSRWTKDQTNFTSHLLNDEQMDRSVRFLMIYASIAAANTIFTLIRAFLFAYGGIQAAKHLHENLLHKLLNLNILLATSFNLVGTLVVTVMGLPLMVPVFLLLLTVYYFIQKYYRLTTVELKRLTSLSLSPFYSHLSDTVNGLATIRAQRFVERYRKDL
ncbi:unnamed protein product [Nippostrongylus brasiliensis]|uniref:ABC-type xenobiotic transporter n=1 Tax=Nippostrongylus brasiliensis TaxID=27835 RepID=A0A158R379_NIPBR|nr:unnamed protein product [Nippostrongylus brasiliensis]